MHANKQNLNMYDIGVLVRALLEQKSCGSRT